VVVDDHDMGITHVIRGVDHLTNAARQVQIYKAMGWEVPVFAHIPLIHGPDGAKLSKRHGAPAVEAYRAMGYLPAGLRNYLARLGWSHGDDEIFSRAQFLEWFNLDHLGRSAAQFDEAKLRWVNAQHLKAMPDDALAPLVATQLEKLGVVPDARLLRICALFKDRCDTTVALAQWAKAFYGDVTPNVEELAQHVTDTVRPVLATLASKLADCAWDKAAISTAIKETLTSHGLKMPQLAMPVRVLVMGTAQTPSLDAVLELQDRETVLARLQSV
jgi:glutamyl-tRNA synthetase